MVGQRLNEMANIELAEEIFERRKAAHEKHSINSIEHHAPSDISEWLPILGEEFGEVCEVLTYDKDRSRLREELMDLATVCFAWVSAIDSVTSEQRKED